MGMTKDQVLAAAALPSEEGAAALLADKGGCA
jgi:hypothetical protein